MPDIEIQGQRIHYLDRGKGEVVFMLHGLAGSSRFWEDTLNVLPEGFRGIAPDLPGFGDSEKPKRRYSCSDHLAMMQGLANFLGHKPLFLVGHSMGGVVALLWTLNMPETVRKMILVNVPVSGGRALHGRGRIGAALPGLAAVQIGLHLPPVLWMLRKFLRYYYVLDPRFTKDARKAPLYSLWGNARALKRLDLSPRLSEIKVPTLVIGTRKDGIVRPSEFEKTARKIPGSEAVWIDGAGHCPTLERPEETHRMMMAFLKS
ncbi:MAG: alpha/beta hydrolase [Deltaproteobacteria bacterium]|nr:alpha/beta hydrolase [Deltaproteobacteria bacterium]